MSAKWIGAVLALQMSTSALLRAGEIGQFQSGLYEVVSILELPHLEGQGAKKTAHVCIDASNQSSAYGFRVLSENNPLASCPVSNVASSGETLRFDIKCAGQNAAAGAAKVDLGENRFSAVIDMKMGGKNMTMMEFQQGKWISRDCKANGS